MLEWTGERFLPWIKESTIAYEHLHRYAYAATLVKDKRVLDLACGEGYGSKMLADRASAVVGVDIDENTVSHAAAKYGSPTLKYISGSITSVPIQEDHGFDVIVCFEAIEHIEEQDKLLGEVKRLLKPEGILLVSTPNKVVYRDESKEENPFHVRELYFEEFERLLTRYFKNVRFLGQRIHPSSSIWPIGPSGASNRFQEFVLDRGDSGFQFIPQARRVPLYFIAIASDSTAAPPAAGSVLVDDSDGLIKESQTLIQKQEEDLRNTKTWAEEAIRWREEQVKVREGTISSLEEAVKWREQQIQDRDKQIQSIAEGLEWTRNRAAEMEKTIASNNEALAWRAKQVDALQYAKSELENMNADLAKVNVRLESELEDTQRHLNHATEQLKGIYASSGWKFVLRVRGLRDSVFPAGTGRRRVFEKLMELVRPRA